MIVSILQCQWFKTSLQLNTRSLFGFKLLIMKKTVFFSSFIMLGIFSAYQFQNLRSSETHDFLGTCYSGLEEYGKDYYRCNAKVKDQAYRIKCQKGGYRRFFYCPERNGSGLCHDEIGYIGLNDWTNTNLGTDLDRACRKLCECD
jgi:hypothetical protein